MKPSLKRVTLPTKPSALLRLAVKDAKAVAKMKTRRLDMNVWHTYSRSRGRCYVCMAGAVMDRTLGAKPKAELDIFDFPAVRDQLLAIDNMRTGWIYGAVERFGLAVNDDGDAAIRSAHDLVSRHYNESSGRAPWHIYLKAADILEAGGL